MTNKIIKNIYIIVPSWANLQQAVNFKMYQYFHKIMCITFHIWKTIGIILK